MKFDSDLGDHGLVYDANRILIPYPIRGDTETGVVERYGVADGGGCDYNKITQTYTPPLTVEPVPIGWENPYE